MPWFFSLVYGSSSHSLRRQLWEALSVKALNISRPWLIIGDFNFVSSQHEILGSLKHFVHRSTDFNQWIKSARLD